MPKVAPPSAFDHSLLLPGPRWRKWLAGCIFLACAVAFVADLTHDVPWALGVFYLPLVCTATFFRDPRWPWWLAAGAIVMVLLGSVFPVLDLSIVPLVNAGLSVGAILATAVLLRQGRCTQDRLAQQTQGAQAADRLKTQILASLSDELRAPAEAIVALSESLVAAARLEQRGILDQLRSAGERLLMSIANLLDLAAASDRTVRLETLDIALIVRQAVDAVRHSAAEKHVWLESNTGADLAPAIADAWAVRRIVDNLISNALKFTPPSGHVRVGVEAVQDRVAIVVEDTGPGVPAETLRHLGEPFLAAMNGISRPGRGLGNGLALCRKLADAMGATLAFSSEPGQGTHVRMTLPTA